MHALVNILLAALKVQIKEVGGYWLGEAVCPYSVRVTLGRIHIILTMLGVGNVQ